MPRAGRGCGDTSSGRRAVSSAACHRGCSADGGILCARTRHRRGSALHHPASSPIGARLPEVRVAGPHRCWRDYHRRLPAAGPVRSALAPPQTRRAARPVPLFAHSRGGSGSGDARGGVSAPRAERVGREPGGVDWGLAAVASWASGCRCCNCSMCPSCPRSSRTSSVTTTVAIRVSGPGFTRRAVRSAAHSSTWVRAVRGFCVRRLRRTQGCSCG